MLNQVRKLLTGEELKTELTHLPPFYADAQSADERLMFLNDLYDVYIPSAMSEEIYYKLYMAMIRSVEKKLSKEAVMQRNMNFRHINTGIIGGSDSFSIIGTSGIGKTSAIGAALNAMDSERLLTNKKPYMKVIPALSVQCPFDCSVKSLLFSILCEIEIRLGNPIRKLDTRTSTDMLIYLVSQACLNHVGVLVVDEIQNVIGRKNGKLLIGSLMQLINSSGIGIAMVGTPEALPFFEQQVQLARRGLGLSYGACGYDEYFKNFCRQLYDYQYVIKKTEFDVSIAEWLYKHSNGIVSVVVSLMHDAQEIAIISGYEKLDFSSLNKAYEKRMGMMHSYLELKVGKNVTKAKRKSLPSASEKDHAVKEGGKTDELLNVEHVSNVSKNTDIYELVSAAKQRGADVVSCLSRAINIVELKI